MDYLSIFSGIGGFDLALIKNGFNCVGFAEINDNCNKILNFHFPDIYNYGDIEKIETKKLPEFDLLVGGTPCQNFTILGDKKGIAGKDSRLFLQFIRLLKEKQPAYF